jgi:hypothetical protein
MVIIQMCGWKSEVEYHHKVDDVTL